MRLYPNNHLILCNDSQGEVFAQMANDSEFSIDDDGWALVAPFGDKKYPLEFEGHKFVIQRLTKESAETIVNAFQSWVGKAKRFFRGAPMYVGHPDDPKDGHKYPHKDAVGVFRDLKVGDKGLYARPVFTDKGSTFLNGEAKLYPSVRWPVAQTGEKDGVPVFEPFNLTSIGMVRNPNLPTEMLNSKTETIMEKNKLIALLATLGLTLTNEATDIEFANAFTDLSNRLKAAETETATLKTTAAELKTRAEAAELTIANDRKAKATELINERIKSGAITEAEKPLWEKRLQNDFVNEAPVLSALQSKIKTTANPGVTGDRSRTPSAIASTEAKIFNLVNERMSVIRKTGGVDESQIYPTAYQQIATENPALIEALSKPAE